MIQIAVLGATGRMGRMLVRLIDEDPDLRLTGAASEPGLRNRNALWISGGA